MTDQSCFEEEGINQNSSSVPFSTHELISIALTEQDEVAAWDAVVTLHYRGTREIFDAACQLCMGNCHQEKRLGANILGQLGIPKRTYPVETVHLLVQLLETEKNECVLQAICSALGHFHDARAISAVSRLRTHSSANVRFSVVFGVLGHPDTLAIATLIELSRDQDDDVRNWATFGIGRQIDVDTPQIRAALLERVVDEDEDTRGEALFGLARRKDQRIVEPLIQELNRCSVAKCHHSIDAAEELADPRLLPVLMNLKQSELPGNTTFDDAIRRCSAGKEEGTGCPS
ncbi:hypothetical protein BH10PLA2_BH10PLA2_14490 [soil metagenome]